MVYKNIKAMICLPDGTTEFFNIGDTLTSFLFNIGDTLASFLFVVSLDYVLWASIDQMKQNGWALKKKQEADDILEKLLWIQIMQII